MEEFDLTLPPCQFFEDAPVPKKIEPKDLQNNSQFLDELMSVFRVFRVSTTKGEFYFTPDQMHKPQFSPSEAANMNIRSTTEGILLESPQTFERKFYSMEFIEKLRKESAGSTLPQ